jgi:pyruvate/2-oxoglutarate dehydrogenase complex dihydrolipoamide acyltransferase (E2) component
MANQPAPAFEEAPWPVLRNALVSYLDTKRTHAINGFVEVDVTDALEALRAVQRQVRVAVSFHSFMVYCLTQALIEHPTMLQFRKGNTLIRFEDIDVLTPIEKKFAGGMRIPVAYIVRAAQKKSLAQINWELRSAIRAENLAGEEAIRLRRKFGAMPSLARKFLTWRTRVDPVLFKKLHGTVLLTNVQTHGFGNAAAVFGPTVHTLSIGVGTTTDRLKLNDRNEVVNRKTLMLSGTVDHEIVDGMVATRFIVRMTKLVESGAGLDDSFVAETRSRMAAGSVSAGVR